MKITLLVIAALIIVGCNDQPLPAFADSKERCQQVGCGEFHSSSSDFIANYHWSTQPSSQYPDSSYDQIRGVHDYSAHITEGL